MHTFSFSFFSSGWICFVMFLFCFVLFFFFFNFPSWYQFNFVSFSCWKFNFTYFAHNYDNYAMFRDVLECSMFHVPCSMFLVLSTSSKNAWHRDAWTIFHRKFEWLIFRRKFGNEDFIHKWSDAGDFDRNGPVMRAASRLWWRRLHSQVMQYRARLFKTPISANPRLNMLIRDKNLICDYIGLLKARLTLIWL